MLKYPFFKGRRVLVTGAAGFIGSRLIHQLLEHQASITAFVSPSSKAQRLEGVANALNLVRVDITDKSALTHLVKEMKPEIVYHLASYGTQPQQQDFSSSVEINILGTANLLSALDQIDFQSFVQSGSSAEYGFKKKPMKPDDALEPNTFYGATKAAASLLAQTYGKMNARSVTTLRLFYVYGPGENTSRFIPTVIRACLQNTELPLTSLQEKKDFIYIDDVIDAFLLAASSKIQDSPILNVGSSIETTLGEVIETVERLSEKKLRFVEGTYQNRRWESGCWAADIKSTQTRLGWKPTITLKDGLKKTIAWLSNSSVDQTLTQYK